MTSKDRTATLEAPAVVYVASSEGRTKIGLAQDAGKRMRQLTTGSGTDVKLETSRTFSTRLSALWAERELHRRFGRHRLKGEWFAISPERALAALAEIVDPQKHTDSWAPGMPTEVAQAGPLERFKWLRANNEIDIGAVRAMFGRNEARRRLTPPSPSAAPAR